MKKVLWVKFGWSEFYRGGSVDGNFSYLKDEGKQGHEAYNFEPAEDGTYHCYVPDHNECAPKNDDRTGWTVICLARYPKRTGIHIVGWYEDATLLGRYVRKTRAHLPVAGTNQGDGWTYCITSTTAYFVPPEERTMPFSHSSIGQGKYSFLAGPDVETKEKKDELLQCLKRLLKKLRPVAIPNPTDISAPDPGAGPAKLLASFGTPEHRKMVEKAAEKAVKRHYKAKGFSCENVTKLNCGFDFVFTKERKKRHVEVKGTSGAVARFFMTCNENAYRENRSWRFAIVTNALDSNPTVHIYDNRQFKKTFNLDPYVFVGMPAIKPDSL